MLRITFNTVVRYYDSARNGVGQSRSKVVQCLPFRFATKFSYVTILTIFHFKFWIGDINDISLKIRLRGGKGRFFLVLFSFLAIRIFVSEKDYYVKFGWRSMSIIIIKNGAKSWHLSMKFIFRYVFKRKKEDKIFLRKIINVHYDRWYHLLSMEN